MFLAWFNKNIPIGTATITYTKSEDNKVWTLKLKDTAHILSSVLKSIASFYIFQTAFKSTDLEEDWIWRLILKGWCLLNSEIYNLQGLLVLT